MRRNILVLALVLVLAFSLVLATPVMAQGMFVKYSTPVLVNGPGTFDSQLAGSAWVIFEDNTFKMWYTGLNQNGDFSICRAESLDGINWTKNGPITFSNPPASWEANGQATPCVIQEGTGYYMWYTGVALTNIQIGYATSGDGTNWTRHGSVLTGTITNLDSAGVAFPCVINDSGIYRMWYTGRTATSELKIGTATFDGTTWVKSGSAVLTRSTTSGDFDDKWVAACSVVKEEPGVYTMYYTGFKDTISNGIQARIGKASSPDGIVWTKYGFNPVLDIGTSGSWDDKGVAAPCVLIQPGITRMWYTGGRSDLSFKIGYAYELPTVEGVPATSNLTTGIIIGGIALVMGVALWETRRYQFRKK